VSRRLVICNNRRLTAQKPSCGAIAIDLAEHLERLLTTMQLQIAIEYKKCLGQCDRGPNIRLAPAGRFFHNVGEADFPEIIGEIKQFLNG
jgi:(2Fe-2S) ferredoxin